MSSLLHDANCFQRLASEPMPDGSYVIKGKEVRLLQDILRQLEISERVIEDKWHRAMMGALASELEAVIRRLAPIDLT